MSIILRVGAALHSNKPISYPAEKRCKIRKITL